jgi:hypothetical protein
MEEPTQKATDAPITPKRGTKGGRPAPAGTGLSPAEGNWAVATGSDTNAVSRSSQQLLFELNFTLPEMQKLSTECLESDP